MTGFNDKQLRQAMWSVMEHIADCERRGCQARPKDGATKDALIAEGLIEERPPPPGAHVQKPHWVLTDVARGWL